MNSPTFSTLHATPGPRFERWQAPAGERALVLGGGGSTGNAWLIGVVAGLHEAGLDVSRAGLIIGTSAGSTAAAQITAADPARLLEETLAAVPRRRTAPPEPPRKGGPARPAASPLDRTLRIIAAAGNPDEMRRSMGAAALERDSASDGSWQAAWLSTVAARLPSQLWPEQHVAITAVDAATGEPVVFDRHSGVELADAIAASCSSSLPYGIGNNHYIDGGYRRSSENADLAAGCRRVLVLSPFGGRSLHPPAWGMHLAAQLEDLRAAGATVQAIVPDASSEHLFGANAMDLSLRPAAARAGHGQGIALAGQIAGFWG
ncbi:patatin-like phospholipase family protein [Arthrobacter sp. HY1533]|uniref:patatin-like phospholipase family protein n=1 Tax=Arthrobacter sp. HY1533 TaxID=2970919 RepID=UPI0022B9DF76|nr:patatin-like phospholipase family protein [Arthrobacter sp. HY1533]